MENTAKLQSSESKMQEHKANMAVLGKEAAAALAAVESQQQRLTSQRLLALVWYDFLRTIKHDKWECIITKFYFILFYFC